MLDFEVKDAEQNPPLWKDLTFASAIALVLLGTGGRGAALARVGRRFVPPLLSEAVSVHLRPSQREPFLREDLGQDDVAILEHLHFDRHPVVHDAADV